MVKNIQENISSANVGRKISFNQMTNDNVVAICTIMVNFGFGIFLLKQIFRVLIFHPFSMLKMKNPKII